MNGCWILDEWGYANDDSDWVYGSATAYLAPGPVLAEVAITNAMVLDTVGVGGCGILSFTTRQPDGSDATISLGTEDSGGPYAASVWDPNMSSLTYVVAVLEENLDYRVVMQIW